MKSKDEMVGGILSYDSAGEGRSTFSVDEGKVFDLVSLTKPLVTATGWWLFWKKRSRKAVQLS